ncbi:DNA transposition AAA+ family ATPase [Kitasatospora sp. MAP12-15]|uniref:ATP-binding protein n=1 Tax=unclassified Kitasatospora TaxID=2633591 RepID=UPI00247390EA|nr:ATP-binding protein [Kitasatospora sp. MAP12-44]MDH6112313.1 DNA transposition AAA+ family ATPase [Kitasatospora sp. MAP12-44]
MTVRPAPDPTGEMHWPLTTKEGWRAFVDESPDSPPVIGPGTIALSPAELLSYEEARIDYHSRLVIVATPTIRQVVTSGRKRIVLNRHQVSARRGLIVTGSSGTGKTTAITQLGKNHEQLTRRRIPTAASALPVVYVTVPPAATPKMLAGEFARFLGIPLHHKMNQIEITNAVCDLLGTLSTTLVLVDEIHNLNLATRSGAEASDQLKYLSERIPATFVLAGIDVESSGLFLGTRGQQIAGRYSVIRSHRFGYQNRTDREQWQALVATLEGALRLHNHPVGTLLAMDDYLHQRTSGLIGSLSHLVREAAVDAVTTGTERITKAMLDEVDLDLSAHQPQPEPPRKKRVHKVRSAA